MAIPVYKVVLGRKKYRNDQEVEALVRAVGGSNDPPIKALVLDLDSLQGVNSQLKLLQSLSLIGLEYFSLNLEYSTGAEGLQVLASAIESGKLPSLRRLQICYRENPEVQLRTQYTPNVQSSSRSKSSEVQQLSSSSFSLLSTLGSSSSSFSTFSCNGLESSQSQSKSRKAATPPASWEGFALLGQVLQKGLLQSLEGQVIFESNWKSTNLGDTGSRSLAQMIGTGFFSGLKELLLEDNAIGTDGMTAIADALRDGKLITLETLNISHNCFTPVEGLLRVLSVIEENHLPALKKLQLLGAGRLRESSHGAFVAEEIVGVFTRNSSLTAEVEMEWPSKLLQSRWTSMRKRNEKLIRRTMRTSQAKAPAMKAASGGVFCFQKGSIFTHLCVCDK